MNELDLVYILGRGSNWQNNELRYSLRSVEKFVTGIRNVFIIGEKPSFINDQVIHIPYKDVYTNKARNIMAKILRACNDSRMTKNFMLWNDDYFAIQPFSAIDYPYYFKCDLHHSVRINKSFNYYVTYCKSKQLFFPSLLKKEQKQTEPAHRLTHQLTQPLRKLAQTKRLQKPISAKLRPLAASLPSLTNNINFDR